MFLNDNVRVYANKNYIYTESNQRPEQVSNTVKAA